MFILWRYILNRHVTPFLFSVSVLVCIFLLQYVMQKMDQLAGKGLSATVIAEFIIMNLAWMVVLAVPMAVLVATLMAFGNLSSGSEITAMRANGVSLYRMMAPVFVASVVIFYLLIQFNNKVLPDANHRARVLMTDIYRKKPTFSLVPGLFSQEIQGYGILVRKTFEHSNDLEGVTIFDYTNSTMTTTLTAERGTVSFSPDYQKLIMDLSDGEVHEISNTDPSRYRRIRFQKHRIVMNAEGFEFQRSQESAFARGDRELSAQAMIAVVDSLRTLQEESRAHIRRLIDRDLDGLLATSSRPQVAKPPASDPTYAAVAHMSALRNMVEGEYTRIEYYGRQIHEYTVEIHKKYSIPFACIVFVLVGIPLGIMARKGTFGVAASLSLGFFLLYWACLIGGEKLADRGFIQPWFGMWSANIIIGLMGLYLTYKTARESLTINWESILKFIPRQWRSEEEPA
jgi:lipopolysaccharide export system permease protein